MNLRKNSMYPSSERLRLGNEVNRLAADLRWEKYIGCLVPAGGSGQLK